MIDLHAVISPPSPPPRLHPPHTATPTPTHNQHPPTPPHPPQPYTSHTHAYCTLNEFNMVVYLQIGILKNGKGSGPMINGIKHVGTLYPPMVGPKNITFRLLDDVIKWKHFRVTGVTDDLVINTRWKFPFVLFQMLRMWSLHIHAYAKLCSSSVEKNWTAWNQPFYQIWFSICFEKRTRSFSKGSSWIVKWITHFPG